MRSDARMVQRELPGGELMSGEQRIGRIGIIGGGMLGLGAAKLLSEAGHRVTVFEAADHVGGLADPWTVGDLKWDRHYHVISPADETLLRLIDDIGLSKSVHWSPTRTGAYADGTLYPVTTTMELLRYPPLRLTGQVPARPDDPGGVQNQGGKHPRERPDSGLADQMVGAAGVHDLLEATAQRQARTSPRDRVCGLHLGDRPSALRRPAQRSQARSLRMGERGLPHGPGGIGRPSRAGRRQHPDFDRGCDRGTPRVDGVQVTDSHGNSHDFDQVLITLPPAMAAKLLPDLPPDERERLLGVSYLGVVCASMVTSQPVTDCYVTNLIDPQPFTGIIEMSSLIDPEQLKGKTLVYLPRYALSDDPVFDEADSSIEARFIAALESMFEHFDRSDVEAFRVSRARYVIPRPILGYSETLPAMRTSIPGVTTASTAHIVNGTQNVNEVLDLAVLAVAEIDTQARRPDDTDNSAIWPTMRPPRQTALSFDLDNLWSYLMVHGDATWKDYPSYLDRVVPVALELLAERNLKITFFIVGIDAAKPAHKEILQSIVEAGHEIGNHSYHHEPWLHRYDRGRPQKGTGNSPRSHRHRHRRGTGRLSRARLQHLVRRHRSARRDGVRL